MSVWVVDNGEHYSDHTIYFVDVPEAHRAILEAQFGLPGMERFKVLGKVSAAEWQIVPMSVGEFCENTGWRVDVWDDGTKAPLVALRHLWIDTGIPESFPYLLEV